MCHSPLHHRLRQATHNTLGLGSWSTVSYYRDRHSQVHIPGYPPPADVPDSHSSHGKWGLTINIAKTKYMSLGTDINHLEMDNSDIIIGCTEFRYLGSLFTKDGRDTKNTCLSVAQARKMIGGLNGIWWSNDITKN